MGYFKKAFINTFWAGLSRISVRLLTFVKLFILARILNPSDFGAVGVAGLVLAFLEIFTETGINIFLIQQKKHIDKYINTAYVVSVVRGILIFLIIFLTSPLISSFFSSDKSLCLIKLISFTPLIRGFINPSVVKLRSELRFRKEFFLTGAISFTEALVAISISLYTKDPKAIVLGMIASAILEVVLTHILFVPKPRLKFDLSKIKTVINRGKWLTAAGIFNYLFENIDDIYVGKMFSDFSLGIYQVAYKLSSLPITEFGNVINRVTLPVMVKINNNKNRLFRAYLKSFLIVNITSFIFSLVIYFFSYKMIVILLGNSWVEADGVVKIMAFFGFARSITVSSYPLFLSLKRQDIVSKITFANILFLIVGLFLFIKPYGFLGVGMAAVLGAVFGIPLTIYFAIKVYFEKEKDEI